MGCGCQLQCVQRNYFHECVPVLTLNVCITVLAKLPVPYEICASKSNTLQFCVHPIAVVQVCCSYAFIKYAFKPIAPHIDLVYGIHWLHVSSSACCNISVINTALRALLAIYIQIGIAQAVCPGCVGCIPQTVLHASVACSAALQAAGLLQLIAGDGISKSDYLRAVRHRAQVLI